MNPLPDIIRKNGFTYTKVLRDGRKCIYEQMYCEGLHYFEVFTVQQSRERVLNGKTLLAKEVFPCNEDFGKTAWSCRTLADAMKHFNSLVSQ